MMENKRVVIGLSGGVDSSVAAYLLKEEGYEVVGITLNHGQDEEIGKEIEVCQNLCEKLKIEYHVVDIEDIFKKEVMEDFIEGYRKGITPSPCVICDERVKFKMLFEIANNLGIKYIATGHYAKIEYSKEFEKFLITKTSNMRKDQGYMLSRIKSSDLERILFPLYRFEKPEIRAIAKKIGLEVHDKKDSQGICFAKEGYIEFLEKHLGEEVKSGNFVDKFGNVLGIHRGYIYYTVGQRRGLGLKLPRPYFIIEIRPFTNEIVLGEYDDLKKKRVILRDFVEHIEIERLKDEILIGRPRFSSFGDRGKIYLEDGNIYFEYEDENFHNAEGQHLVIYLDKYIIGSGMIEFEIV